MNRRFDQTLSSRLTAGHALLGALACAALLVLTGVVALLVPAVHARDALALQGFTELNHPHVNALANRIAHMADGSSYVVVALILVVVAALRRRPRLALAVAVTLVAAPATSELLKPLLAEPRPTAVNPFGASWPSGHSTAAMTMALCAVLVAPRFLRPAAAALGALFSVAVAFSLLTLAWHLPSDVLGGYLVAATWTLVAVAAVRAADDRWPARSGRMAVARAGGALIQGRGASAAERLLPAVVLGSVAFVVAAVVVVRPHAVASFAADHLTLVVAGAAIAGLAALLASALALALRR